MTGSEMIGRQLGDYRLIAPVGVGGMGQVYLAEHTELLTRYCVKILPESLAAQEGFVARFQTEARIMARLNHPNLVRVFHLGRLDTLYYLVMDYVVGPGGKPASLAEFLRTCPENRASQEQVERWVVEMCLGLGEAHRGGVIHRDLKPANVLLDERGGTKITDFGIAALLSEGGHVPVGVSLSAGSSMGSSHGQVAGTIAWMSPEQRRGMAVDARSDIFSLGKMIYRMLVGRLPGMVPTLPSVAVHGLNPKWDTVVKRCLQEDPSRRYENVEAILKDLQTQDKSGQKMLSLLVKGLAAAGSGPQFQPSPLLVPGGPLPRARVNMLGMELARVDPGLFLMGSVPDDPGAGSDEAAHPVQITKPYYLSTKPVTLAQYAQFVVETGRMAEDPPEVDGVNPAVLPAVNVSHEDALAFCHWLSAWERQRYVLPTEAQWEYACRAGTRSAFWSGSDSRALAEIGWFDGNASILHPVGQREPNPWGFYDMHGNVWQWCSDGYGPYGADFAVDPAGHAYSHTFVVRGGSWEDAANLCRSAARQHYPSSYRAPNVGFRVALIP